MRLPALYVAGNGASPLPVHVRLHTKFDALGDQTGTNLASAEREEIIPRILFMRSELPFPARGAIISVEPGEAYRIDHVEPADDITITANVIRLSKREAEGLPTPGVPTDG